MMLWMTQFFSEEPWAELQRRRSLATLDRMWIDDGYFCREPYLPDVRFAVSVGLQAVDAMPDPSVRSTPISTNIARAMSTIATPSRM
jgi:hypothetical protein